MPTTRIPRRRQPAPPPSKQQALLGAITSLVPAGKASTAAKSRGGKRKSAGGLALLAGLGAAAMKAKNRRGTQASS